VTGCSKTSEKACRHDNRQETEYIEQNQRFKEVTRPAGLRAGFTGERL
jgi:hypothetical protein